MHLQVARRGCDESVVERRAMVALAWKVPRSFFVLRHQHTGQRPIQGRDVDSADSTSNVVSVPQERG
jgi:hypothetical protein